MGTATMPRTTQRAGNEIKLEYGQPQVFALKFLQGKSYEGNYGPRVLFTLVDERKLWLDGEDGSDLEHRLGELGVQRADFIRVTKIRHARGGGHSLRVERAVEEEGERDPQPGSGRRDADRTTEALLEQSIERAREARKPEEAAPIPMRATAPREEPRQLQSNGNAGIQITPASARMVAAMCAAVESVIETQSYAARKGLGLTFSEESVRCIGLSIFIADCQGGRLTGKGGVR